MNNELRKIVEQRFKNAKANALAVGTETPTGKMFTGKAELLDSILEEYVALTIPVVVKSFTADEVLKVLDVCDEVVDAKLIFLKLNR